MGRRKGRDMKTIGRVGIVVVSLVLLVGCSDAQDHLRKAAEAEEAEDYHEAIRHYTLAIESGDLPQSDLAKAYYGRAGIHEYVQHYGRAIADYTKAIELAPKNGDAYTCRGFAYVMRDHPDMAITDDTKAIADCTKAIALEPENSQAYSIRAYAYDMKGDLDRAVADCNKAIELFPKNAFAYNVRSGVYEKMGQKAKSEADLTKAAGLLGDVLRLVED